MSPSASVETSITQTDSSKSQNKTKKPNTQGILNKQVHPPRQTPITQKVAAPRHRKFQNGSKKLNSLNIVHFNPDGIRGRQTNILNYTDQENTHVVAVSETHLKPSQHFSLGNFIPIRKDRTEKRKGGVAFFINTKIEFTVNDWFNKYPNLEALSVKISPSEVTRAPIDLVVYYNPPSKVIDQRLFEIVNRNSNNVVIIGDLNSPHTSFGSRITTESGIE